MLKMFYGISFKNLFGLFLVVLPDNSYLTNGSATSTFEITTGYRCSESFASAPLESSIKCARACIRDGNCTAASYDTAGKICELHSGNMYSERNGTNSTIVAAQGWELLTPANLTNIPANTSGLHDLRCVCTKNE